MTKKGIPVLIGAAAAVLAAAVVRFFLYVSFFDFSTGFYTAGSGTPALFFRLLLLAEAVILLTLCVVGERRGWTAFTVSSDGMGAKATAALGAVFLAAAVVQLWEIVGTGLNLDFRSIVQAIVFAVCGFLLLKNSVPPVICGFLQLIPSVCLFLRALSLFNSDLVIRSHSDDLIVLLAYIFGAVFFTCSARCYARLEAKHSRLREMFFAALTFLFSGVHLLSKLLAYLFGGTAVLGMNPPDKTVICLLLLSGGFLGTLCLTAQKKSIEYLIEEKSKDEKEDNEENESNKMEKA